MEETKKWYESKTIVGAVAAVVASILTILMAVRPGTVTPEESTQIQSNISAIVTAVVSLVGAAVAIWGRITANKSIG